MTWRGPSKMGEDVVPQGDVRAPQGTPFVSAGVATMAATPAPLALRPYQHEAAEAVVAGYRRGLRRLLVQLPTGMGKTVLFAHLAHTVVKAGGGSHAGRVPCGWPAWGPGRVLVVAHRDELLAQAREKLLLADPAADVGIVRAETDETAAAIVVASIQTIIRPARLERLGRFDLIVIDEAHHAAASSYRRVLEALGAFEDSGPCVLGVTATPGRGDGVGLDSVFQEIVYAMSILDGIRGGYLCDLRAVSVQLATDFADVRTRSGDLAEGELGDALLAADAPEHVRDAYLEHANGRRAIVFTPTVAVARSMAEALAAAGVPAAWVSGETPRDERAAILAALRSGEIRAVANCAVLVEGLDCAVIDCVVTARPTKSPGFYAQMIGRGTRPYPGKDDCLILDVIGQAGRHDLLTAASLFGLPPTLLAGRTVTEALEESYRAEDARPVEAGRLVARSVDLFTRRPLHWVQASPERFVLPIPDGRVALELGARGWTATLEPYDAAPSVLGRDLPLEYAQGVAEDRVRALGAVHLVDPDAAWRRRPASEKQLAVLARRRIGTRPGITAGEASDLIAAGGPHRRGWRAS